MTAHGHSRCPGSLAGLLSLCFCILMLRESVPVRLNQHIGWFTREQSSHRLEGGFAPALFRAGNVPSSTSMDLEYELSKLGVKKQEAGGSKLACVYSFFLKNKFHHREEGKPPRVNKCFLRCRSAGRKNQLWSIVLKQHGWKWKARIIAVNRKQASCKSLQWWRCWLKQ